MNVSFAWTTEAYMKGIKTVSRRFWKPAYARQFKRGSMHVAVNKDFRAGGERIGLFRVRVAPYQEALEDMTEDHFIREGGTMYWEDREDFIRKMGGPKEVPWVLEFDPFGCAACRDYFGFMFANLKSLVCRKCGARGAVMKYENDLYVIGS